MSDGEKKPDQAPVADGSAPSTADLLDRGPQGRCEPLAHGLDVRRELRRLGNDRDIHIADPPTRGFEPTAHPAQQIQAVGVLPARVAVRKMPPDIAVRRRAQQRIGQGMRHDIGIRVAGQPLRMGHNNPAQHKRAPVDEAVRVKAYTCSIPVHGSG